MRELSDDELAALRELERLARRAAALNRTHARLRRQHAAGRDVQIELARVIAHHFALRRRYERVEMTALQLAQRVRATKAD